MPHKITMITRPLAGFEIPSSEGHQLYSAILGILKEAELGPHTPGISPGSSSDRPLCSPLGGLLALDGHNSGAGNSSGISAGLAEAVMAEASPAFSAAAHSSTQRQFMTSFSLCPLQGRFKRSHSPRRKELDPAERYGLNVGITDSREVLMFQSALGPLLSRQKNLRLKAGELRVEELAGSSASFEELMQTWDSLSEPYIDFEFKSVTCIPYRNSRMFEMFPHREAVFHSLLSKWNCVCPGDIKISLERDDLRRYISERPLAYETKSTVINTVYDRARSQARPVIRLGFVGCCRYAFSRDAPQELRRAICALARFAEYSGVGSSVGHGCGAVAVRIGEGRA